MSEQSVPCGEPVGNDASVPRFQMQLMSRYISIVSLALSDVLTFVVAEFLFRHGRNVPELMFAPASFTAVSRIDLFYILGALFVAVRYLAGDYTKRQLFWDGARLTTIGLLFASAPCFLLFLFVPVGYSSFAVFGSWLFVIIAVPGFRHLTRWSLSKLSIWQLPTALLGSPALISEAYGAFCESLALGFDVKYLVTMGETKPDFKTHPGVTMLALCDPKNIVRRLKEGGCQQVVIATEAGQSSEIDTLIERVLEARLKVAIIPPLRGLPLLGLTTNYFFGRELLLLHVRNNLGRLPSKLFKRLVDVVGAAVLLVALLPVFLVIAWLIKRADRGSPFFVQSRVGLGGREFACIKFRTMHADAEKILANWRHENSPQYLEYIANNFKLRDDPRATGIGRWLRRSSLDELPQLFNVLKGDMSLVGPRPLLPREIAAYGESIELYKQIRPGITGLWQISGRSATRFTDRIASDEWYIKNWSFWYDIVILIKTVGVLISRDGAY